MIQMGGYPYKIDGNRIDEHILKYADEFDELTVGGSLFSQFYRSESVSVNGYKR